MFATHYHILIQYFTLYDNIRNCLMSSEIDQTNGRIHFHYKLVEGGATKSFGIKVAQMIGLPVQVIDLAMLKSEEENQAAGIEYLAEVNQLFNETIEFLQYTSKDDIHYENLLNLKGY